MRLGFAVMFACVALLLGWRDLESPGAISRLGTVPVVIAVQDMPEGIVIDRRAVVVAEWPIWTQPAGAYASVDSVVGRVTRVPVYKGEAIVPGRLAPASTVAGMGVKLTPGKRAYSIRIDDVASLDGMVQPNRRADIMVVIDDANGVGNRVAKLFMSNVWVLGISRISNRAPDGRPIDMAVVTIEVSPEGAERLAIASSAQGQIQFVLRGHGDPEPISSSVPPTRDLLLRRYQPSRTTPPDSVRLTVRRGSR